MKGDYLATHWVITTLSNDVRDEGGIMLKEWQEGMIPAGEGLRLISLVSKIINATQNISAGEIVIYNDNKKLVR